MGNSSSSPRRQNSSSAAEPDAEPVVSEALVDQVFSSMKDAFERTTQDLDDVEKGFLLLKLCSKFREEYPSFAAAASVPLPTLPFEILVPHVACFLPRSSLDNLKVTCKQMKQAIDNRELMTPPWGTICPFQFPPPDEIDRPLGSVIFSNDGSRVAVFTMGTYLDDDDEEESVPGTLQVWDRRKGLIGELECAPDLWYKPVFSPDSQLLVLGPRDDEDGIRVCYLPNDYEQVPIVVSFHELNGERLCSVAFLDNTTIAFMVQAENNGVKTCNVTLAHDRITLTEPVQTTLVDPGHSGTRGGWWGRLASFSSTNKDILAFVYDIRDRTIILHDRRTNASVEKLIPADSAWVTELAFSPDGNHLVVAHLGGGLSVFDCNGDTVEEIGEARAISLDGTSHYRNISFSPGSASRIAVAYFGRPNQPTRIRIIDIENEQILCNEWDGSSWKLLVS